MESRSKNSIKNIFWGYFNTILGMMLHFVNRTVFIRYLGIEYLGINGLFSNILSMLSLADLGFTTAMAFSYYKPIATGNTEEIAALNYFYKKIYTIIAIAISVVGLSIMPFLKYIINLDREIDHLNIYYILTLAGTVSTYIMMYKSSLISAYQKNYIVSKYNSLIKMLITVVQIIVIIVSKNYVMYLAVVLVGNLTNNLTISFIADKLFPFIKEKIQLSKEKKTNIFQNIKSVFIYKISGVLINGTDNLLISTLVGTIWVGYYSNYLIIINNIQSFITMTFSSLTAGIGNVMVTENPEKREELFDMIQVASFWFSLVIVPCICALINCFITTWLGTEYILTNWTVIAIILNLYLTCVLQPIWIYREAAGIYMQIKYIMILTAILNIGLSIWWGIYWDIAGILFASAASKVLTYIWYEPILLFKEYFKGKSICFFVKTLINLLIAIVLSAILIAIVNVISIDGWIGFLIKGIICFLIANLVYILIYHKNKSFEILLSKIKGMIFKKKIK